MMLPGRRRRPSRQGNAHASSYQLPVPLPAQSRFRSSRATCNRLTSTAAAGSWNGREAGLGTYASSTDGPGGPCSSRSAEYWCGDSLRPVSRCRPARLQRVVRAALGCPGFGMPAFGIWHGSILLVSVQQPLERRQPRVFPPRLAAAHDGVQVRPAIGTQAPARLCAERLHRQDEQELLAQQVEQVERPISIDDVARCLPQSRARHPCRSPTTGCTEGRTAHPPGAQRDSRHRPHSNSSWSYASTDAEGVGPDLSTSNRQPNRRGDPVVLVRRIEHGGLEQALEMLARSCSLLRSRSWGLGTPGLWARTQNYTSEALPVLSGVNRTNSA